MRFTCHNIRRRLLCVLAGALVPLAASAQISVGSSSGVAAQSLTAIPSILQTSPTEPAGFAKSKLTISAPTISRKEPVAMSADEMGYDKDNGIVIAKGHVQIGQNLTVLTADEVIYYQKRDIVEAKGNVVMLQPSGDVYFAEHARLTSDMKHGAIEAFRARLSDNSVFVANSAERVNPAVIKLRDAAYTPCHICDGIAPFWQIKSRKTTIDELDERIYYRDAHMEMFGVPFVYSPYFSSPTADAAAKSGLLTPIYSHTNNMGTLVQVPYYWRINHSQEMTITPWYTTDEGWLLQNDYHAVSDGGVFKVQTSITDPHDFDALGNDLPGHQLRGHIYADGEQMLTENSRIGFDIARASDDTYLRRYGFGNQAVLFSRAFYEAAQDRNYVLAQGLSIQGLELTDDPRVTPLVFPDFQGYYETKPMDHNLRLHFFGDAQMLSRQEGPEERRVSFTAGAELPYVSDSGQVITTTLNLRQDFYSVDNVPINGGTGSFDGTVTRTFPQAAVQWRYPLARQFDSDSMTIEPIVLAVLQPYDHNPQEIPNEDNTLIELNDTNLFSLDRMPGLDTIDNGPRLAYGGRGEYLFSGGQSINALLGQDYNFDSNTPFPNSTTAGKNGSDYIGSIGFDYLPFDLTYAFALNSSDFTADRSEIVASFRKPWLALSGAYRELHNNQYLADSREGILNASLPLGDRWTIYGGARRDLKLDQMVATSGGLLYRNECFNLMLQMLRTYSRDRDVEPNTSFTFRFGFKNLGEFGDAQ